MSVHLSVRVLSAALLLASSGLASATAQVVPITLQLSGDVSTLATNSFDSGGKHFDTGVLSLTGLGGSFSVVQGDEIDATITLTNGPFTLPASPEQFFGFNLNNTGTSSPSYDATSGKPAVVDGTYAFKLGGTTVYVPNNANCGNCANLITFAGPGAQVQFDSVQLHMTFGNLTAPYLVESASISYQLSQAVPEPAEWALMVAGLLGVAAAARRRST